MNIFERLRWPLIWSTQAANVLIWQARARGDCLDREQIEYLVYIAHGLSLHRYGKSLTIDLPEARHSGPGYALLRSRLVACRPLEVGAYQLAPYSGAIKPYVKPRHRKLLDEAYEAFGGFSTEALRRVLTEEKSAWERTFATEGHRGAITRGKIRAWVTEILNSNKNVCMSGTM